MVKVSKIIILTSMLSLQLLYPVLTAVKLINEELSWTKLNKKFVNTTIEGCMLIPTNSNNNNTLQNKYLPQGSTLFWPNKRVPYQLSTAFTATEIKTFDDAVKWWNQNTCVRWVKRNSADKDYVNIIKNPGCLSYVGRIGGAQMLSLESACFNWIGTVIHEMMHAIGFIHEQQRPDRDNYVTVSIANVIAGYGGNFDKSSSRYFYKGYGLSYDIHSVMHYNERAFSNGRGNTIVANNKERLGCFNTGKTCPTSLDIQKIKRIYSC